MTEAPTSETSHDRPGGRSPRRCRRISSGFRPRLVDLRKPSPLTAGRGHRRPPAAAFSPAGGSGRPGSGRAPSPPGGWCRGSGPRRPARRTSSHRRFAGSGRGRWRSSAPGGRRGRARALGCRHGQSRCRRRPWTVPGCVVCTKNSHCSCSRSPPARISSRPASSAGMLAIRKTPSGVNRDTSRARSRIIAASVTSATQRLDLDPVGDGPKVAHRFPSSSLSHPTRRSGSQWSRRSHVPVMMLLRFSCSLGRVLLSAVTTTQPRRMSGGPASHSGALPRQNESAVASYGRTAPWAPHPG